MSTEREKILLILKRELDFLEQGGYHAPEGWRPRLIFEDLPTCLRSPGSTCLQSDCALLRFVPLEYRAADAACRYIPLNRAGDTVDNLYRTATQEELEAALRRWLIATIQELEKPPNESGQTRVTNASQPAVSMMRSRLVSSGDNHRNLGRTKAEIQAAIRRRAYEIYERRGKVPGHALEDWLQAEAEVLGKIEFKVAA
ncbi:MAG TPA: DUF2934 domain-containing protein [Terriglobales bacterium]|jgi:hypothetical protein|nr:DUF2934 domain-containing protein [Terriglobales bacterium]